MSTRDAWVAEFGAASTALELSQRRLSQAIDQLDAAAGALNTSASDEQRIGPALRSFSRTAEAMPELLREYSDAIARAGRLATDPRSGFAV